MSNNNEDTPPSPTARRASVAGSRLSELFGRSPPASNGTPAFPGPISAAAHQANQRRRMSIASVGLGASPSQTSPFHAHRDSFSSAGSAAGESAIDDSGDAMPPSSSFARRLSFGARSMASISGEGGGFNWSNEMRNRAQRSSSITIPAGNASNLPARLPGKAASVSTPSAPPPAAPTVRQQTAPDHFQERILKGDFYMD